MRLRQLQRQNEEGQWFDDAYAFEDNSGQVIFRYNLTWGRVGARCNGQIREAGISLEDIETVIPPGEGLRWLPIEVIADEAVEAFLTNLDERCGIPKPRSIAQALVTQPNF